MKYDFKCPKCGMVREVEVEGMVGTERIGKQVCSECGEEMKRVYGYGFGFVIK